MPKHNHIAPDADRNERRTIKFGWSVQLDGYAAWEITHTRTGLRGLKEEMIFFSPAIKDDGPLIEQVEAWGVCGTTEYTAGDHKLPLVDKFHYLHDTPQVRALLRTHDCFRRDELNRRLHNLIDEAAGFDIELHQIRYDDAGDAYWGVLDGNMRFAALRDAG